MEDLEKKVEESPVEESPVEESPVEESPVEESSAEEISATEASVETPAEVSVEVTVEKAPESTPIVLAEGNEESREEKIQKAKDKLKAEAEQGMGALPEVPVSTRKKKHTLLWVLLSILGLAVIAALVFCYFYFFSDGWHTGKAGTSYISSFKKLTGLQTIDNKTYIFDGNGYLMQGTVVVDNNIYYSTPEGIAYGEVEIEGVTYLFDKKDGVLRQGFFEAEDGRYYHNELGFPESGMRVIDEKVYYLNNDGKLMSGWVSGNAGTRYFSSTDYTMVKGIYEINGEKHIFDENGYVLYGLQKTDEYAYYADELSSAFVYGFKEIDGKNYYFDKSGKILNGVCDLDGKKWYMTDGYVATGWFDVNDEIVYATEDGLTIGSLHIDGEEYRFDENGYLITGWEERDGVIRYYNYDGVMLVGWQTIFGKTYYFDEDGALATGLHTIGETLYCFNEDGTIFSGWHDVDGANFYFGEDGAKRTGMTTIDGKLYYLSVSGGFLKPGWQEWRGQKFYTIEDGSLLIGFNTIDGLNYLFGADGYMLTGVQKVDGIRRYFKPGSGEMLYDTTINGIVIDKNGVASASFEVITEENLDDYLAYVIKTNGTSMEALYKWIQKTVPVYSYYSEAKVMSLRKEGKLNELDRYLSIEAINKGKGACWHYASLTKLLFNAAGYTTEIVKGGGHSAGEHNWNVVWQDGQWKHIDSMRMAVRIFCITDTDLKNYKYTYVVKGKGPHPENIEKYGSYTDVYYYGYTLPANP